MAGSTGNVPHNVFSLGPGGSSDISIREKGDHTGMCSLVRLSLGILGSKALFYSVGNSCKSLFPELSVFVKILK